MMILKSNMNGFRYNTDFIRSHDVVFRDFPSHFNMFSLNDDSISFAVLANSSLC